jgi:hypothetical protein
VCALTAPRDAAATAPRPARRSRRRSSR